MVRNASRDEIDFGVFMIHQLAQAWGRTAPDVYRILVETDIFDGYILSCYDTLHTLGAEYLVDDITEFAKERGARI
jgi:hypothetical protein